MNIKRPTEKNGYIALVSILVISGVATLLLVTANILSTQESDMSLDNSQSARAYYATEACIEEGLQQISDSVPFNGEGELTFDENTTCTYNVINEGGQNRTVRGVGETGRMVRRVRVEVDSVRPEINVVSWEEVVSF